MIIIMMVMTQTAFAFPGWVIFWSHDGTTLDGNPVPVGTVITAVDNDGIVCGNTTVGNAGTDDGDYMLKCYKDDSDTPEDEGPNPGENVTFYINGILAKTLGPDYPIWTNDGDYLNVSLAATTYTPVCSDLNNDGIITRDWNDITAAYRCFLGINKNCNNSFQDWQYMKKEYECFIGMNK